MIRAWTVIEKFHTKPSEAVVSTVFPYNFRPEANDEDISGVAVGKAGVDVCVKFGGSRLHGLRDIRGADFVSNEQVSPKNG